MLKTCFFASLYFSVFFAFSQNVSRPLSCFQAEWGFNYSYAFSNNRAVELKPDGSINYFRDERNNFGASTFGRVMASTALNFFQFRENRSLRWGDMFLLEKRLGYRRSQIEGTNHLLLGYNFSIGLIANYLINQENEIGLILVPLKFVSDRVAPNISGSYVALRYGNSKIALSLSYESRDLSFAGWLIGATLNPRQYTLEVLVKKKYGFRTEWAANRYFDSFYGGQYHNSFPSISLFLSKTL